MKKIFLVLLVPLIIIGCGNDQNARLTASTPDNYLRSWREGQVKQRIVAFVEAASTPGNKGFIPTEKRRAVFDMDGTLVCEKPEYLEVVAAHMRLREKLEANPSLIKKPVYKAIAEGNDEFLHKHVKEVLLEAFEGVTMAAYIEYCQLALSKNKHPRFSVSYTSTFYLPMRELITYLRSRDFRVFVVSTSQQEFIRSICTPLLEIPPENAVGTMVAFSLSNLEKDEPQVYIRGRNYFQPYNAGESKAIRLRERAALPAVMAFGNSSGDYAMLDAVSDSGLPNLVCILDHDDPIREYEYHKPELLKDAKARNWMIVSMKRDFEQVFGTQKERDL